LLRAVPAGTAAYVPNPRQVAKGGAAGRL